MHRLDLLRIEWYTPLMPRRRSAPAPRPRTTTTPPLHALAEAALAIIDRHPTLKASDRRDLRALLAEIERLTGRPA